MKDVMIPEKAPEEKDKRKIFAPGFMFYFFRTNPLITLIAIMLTIVMLAIVL